MIEPLRELVPGLLWVKEHPVRLAGGRFLTRMTVMRLETGLCLHSPVEIDAQTRSAIEGLGEVRAIIAPSTFHHFFVASAQQAFPAARTYAVEGLDKKRKDLRFDELLGDEAAGPLGGPDGPGGHRQPHHARGGVPPSREPHARRHGSRRELPRRDPRDQRHAPRVDAPLRHVGAAASGPRASPVHARSEGCPARPRTGARLGLRSRRHRPRRDARSRAHEAIREAWRWVSMGEAATWPRLAPPGILTSAGIHLSGQWGSTWISGVSTSSALLQSAPPRQAAARRSREIERRRGHHPRR